MSLISPDEKHAAVSEPDEKYATVSEIQDFKQDGNDGVDMHRMGKKQEFKRTFGFWPTLGFTSIYIATWEYLLVSVYSGLVNGGFGGLVYEYIGTSIAYFSIVLSLAEMSSMAPTSGGQYHWVSEFAPPRIQKYLSYAAGWTSAMGWIVGGASGYFIMQAIVEALVEIYIPSWGFERWQATLVMIAMVVFTVFFNTIGARALPWIENVSLVGHVLGWIITVVTLWVMAPKNSVHEVFVEVVNRGGWDNIGLSCLVGTVAVLYCQLGPDAAVHIAEEVRDASIVLPRCIVWGFAYNAILGFVMLVTLLFTVGPLNAAINAASPFQNAFIATGSQGVATLLTVILLLLIASGNITAVTTSSRETWAFARDGGLPFHRWIAKVNRHYNAPLNAVYVTAALSVILCLINLGSTIAFNIIISLNLVAFLLTYLLSIGSLLWKRITDPQSVPAARWSLGVLGIPINAFACAYSILALVLSCFPVSVPVHLKSANWAPLILVGVLLIALVSYLIEGRRIYEGPVVFVQGRGEDRPLQKAN